MIRLVVDIGGTSIRLAFKHDDRPDLINIERFACADFNTVDDLLKDYSDRHKLDINELVLAVAAPVRGPQVDITNNHLHFDAGSLAAALGAHSYLLVNDFTAQALAHRDLFLGDKIFAKQRLRCLRGGEGNLGAPLLVIGPGTGLGVSALVPAGSDVRVVESEGGHVSYSPRTHAEKDVLTNLQEKFGHVSAERVVSGPGLVSIYEIQTGKLKSAPEIGLLALSGDGDALAAVNLMLQSLATFAANATISFGAQAGLVIAGGIVPKIAPLLNASGFFERFNDHGRRRSYLQPIPIYLSVEPFASLIGASEAFDNQYLQSRICYLV